MVRDAPTALLTMRSNSENVLRCSLSSAQRHDDAQLSYLFRKFSGRPGRGQSIATSSPLPDSVM